jgi:protein-histidine N-methyltransferase
MAPTVAEDEVKPCYHISFEDLVSWQNDMHLKADGSQLDALPETLSYSPIPLPPNLAIQPLLRRDLYDARFQLASRLKGEDGEEWIDGNTDLVKGLYEGGLKTWEGGLDLVEVLAEIPDLGSWVSGTRVLEVGSSVVLITRSYKLAEYRLISCR